MEREYFRIEIDGEEISDLYADLVSIDVDLDDDMASMFKLKISVQQNPDGTWRYLDDERLSVWRPVVISVGFEGNMEEVISGYITHLQQYFDPDPSQCVLDVLGMDNSVLLDREEKLKDWPNKKDSDIASEIFNVYGFTPVTGDTAVVHDEKVSTIIQRETDMRFLRRLALRNGFECYVDGTNAYFRPPQIDDAPQPVLAVHFGDETNVRGLSFEVDALKGASVEMFQIDRSNKNVLDASAQTSQMTLLGQKDPASLLTSGVDPARVYVGMNVATGNPEMTALCQGLFHEYSWFVTGEGEIIGNKYASVLRPRKTVTIKGAGETYSGVYYVSHVTHRITAEGYTQNFKVKRNAILPSGDEDFGSSGSTGGLV